MKPSALLPVLSAIVAGLLYLPTLRHEFVWDDRSLIQENRFLDDWSRWRENLGGDFFLRSSTPERIGHWRPAVTLSYMVDRSVFGKEPAGYHATNVLLHAAASGLVALLALRIGLGVWGAGFASLLFAVHPAHVESVAWVSGRTDLLCGVLALAALVLEFDAAKSGSWRRRVAAAALALVALTAKEMAVVVPVAVALRAAWLPSQRERERPRLARVATSTWPFAASVVLYAVVRFAILGINPRPAPAAAAGRWTLFWTWWDAFAEYARVLVWPWRLDIVPPVGLAASPLAAEVLAGLGLCAAVVYLAWRARAVAPSLAWALAFLVVAFAPITNFVFPVRAVASIPFPWAERFLYVPSIGACLALGWLARGLGERSARRKAFLAVAAIVLLAAGARTAIRAEEWRDARRLFGASVRINPGIAWTRVSLGVALAESGDEAGAEREYREALRIAPDDAMAHHNIGNLLASRGDGAGAERAYREALRLRPDDPRAMVNLALLLARYGRAAEALPLLESADRILENAPEVKTNLANVLRQLGRSAESVPHYLAALRRSPDLVPALLGLAGAELETGDEADAERHARQVVERAPDLAAGWVVLGATLDALGRSAEARAAWSEALRLDPESDSARRRLDRRDRGPSP